MSAAFNYSLHWLPSQKIEVVGIDINNQIKETMGAAIRLNGFLEILTNPGDHSELLEKGKISFPYNHVNFKSFFSLSTHQ